MIDKETWEFNQDWLDFVNASWLPDTGRVQQIKEHNELTTAFMEKARESFKSKGLNHRIIKVWISIQEPNEGDGYEEGYPHIHYPLNGNTLVHYLDPGDKPAPLHILVDGEVVEEVYPESGLTVFMPNDLWHGVLKNNGTKNRVQMIATGLPSWK